MLKTASKSLLILFFIAFSSISAQFDFVESKSEVGGYGELHYNYSKPESGESQQFLDFHRFVLFYSYVWSDQWSFKAEVELEHNLVGDGEGELELEQAFVNYHHSDAFGFQAGVILPSVGLLNEIHEPPTFLSVERPDYHKIIIPTTWFGNGLSIYGNIKGFDYKASVMEGLDADGFNMSSGIRGGRQKGYKADAEDLLYNFRIDYINIPGLRIGASFTFNDAKGDSINNKISIIEAHARYRAHGLFIDGELANISYGTGNLENSFGYYVDLGYNVGSLLKWESAKLVPFIRFSNLNPASKTINGGVEEQAFNLTQILFGLAYFPINEVVFKIDYANNTIELGDAKTTLINIGVGYNF